MDFLNQLYLPGALTMWGALAFILASFWGYALVLRGDVSALPFARRAYTCFAISIVLAAFVLAFALVTRDFRIEYVYQYSGLELPAHYQFAAFWAGQKGSFLIWLFWGALLGVPLIATSGRQEPTVMIIYQLTLLGLLFILVRENPFVMLAETPADGQGLNPLLQDDWMVIHPPIMFIGYAAAAIPFSFAMAALWRKDHDGWAARAFPWALGGFLVLGTAILMGGYWAYKTLGWGGYWGWDPVENASLVPWIFGTILIHGLYLERTKGRFRRANYVLATLVFLAVLYGTFLTRSGVLADFSVHSFVDLGISGWLLAVMAFFGIGSLVLLATRLHHVPTRENVDPFLSRGSFLVLSTIALMAAALVILFGTSAPLLTGFFENPGQVGPEFYNRVTMPIALLMALLLAFVPFLTWRGEQLGTVMKKLVPSALFALAGTVLAIVLGVHSPVHAIYVFLALLALGSNFHKALVKIRGQGVLKGAGGYLSHVGVGIMLVGFIASSAYDHSTKVTLDLGEPREIADGKTLTFEGFVEKKSALERDQMVVTVQHENGDTYRTYPQLFRNSRTGQIMANPDVRSFPLMDLYVSPLEYDPGKAAGAPVEVELAQGDTSELGGGWQVRFLGFDLAPEGANALAQMESGAAQVAIGARAELVAPDGTVTTVEPLYRFDQTTGSVETPPLQVPGGGRMTISGVDANTGAVRLAFLGIPVITSATGEPPSLSIDVTEKPLIQLVWWGLYVILAGGVLSTIQRLKQAATLEDLQAPLTPVEPVEQ